MNHGTVKILLFKKSDLNCVFLFWLQVDTTQTRRASTDSTSSQLSSRSQRDSLRHRIFHLSELLRVEKANRDDNTSCYVELVSKADREKAPSIRQAFERINQRSSANIAHLEQRLQESLSQLRKIEQRTPPLLGQDNPTVVQQPSSSPRGSWDFLRHPTLSKFRIRSAENASIDELNLPALTESKEEGLVPEAVPKPFLDEASQQRLQELKTQLENIRADYKALEDEWQKLEAAWKGDKQQMMEHLQEEKKRWAHAFLKTVGPGSPSPQFPTFSFGVFQSHEPLQRSSTHLPAVSVGFRMAKSDKTPLP